MVREAVSFATERAHVTTDPDVVDADDESADGTDAHVVRHDRRLVHEHDAVSHLVRDDDDADNTRPEGADEHPASDQHTLGGVEVARRESQASASDGSREKERYDCAEEEQQPDVKITERVLGRYCQQHEAQSSDSEADRPSYWPNSTVHFTPILRVPSNERSA